MTNIVDFIINQVITTSDKVIDYCYQVEGANENTISKRIERLPPQIKKIKGICGGQKSILYDSEKWNTEEYFDGLIDILKEYAYQHYVVLHALESHAGIIEKEKLANYTVSPIKLTKGHKLLNSIIDDLIKLRLISDNGTHYLSESYVIQDDKQSAAIHLVNKLIIIQICDLLRNTGVISYNSYTFDSEYSNYQFGLTAPSYIKSLATYHKGGQKKPAFLLADVLLKQDLNTDDISFFTKKIENVCQYNKNTRILPILLISSHSSEVYSELKAHGIIIGNIEAIFGKEYLETILGIKNLIENAGAIIKTNPQEYIKLLKNIEKLSIGKTYNLKGDLFEMAVGYYHGCLCKHLEISKRINIDGHLAEIDVLAIYQDKVVIAECKGYNHTLDYDFIEKWVKDRIPLIKKWISKHESLNGLRIIFELWSTGGFSKTGRENLEEAANKTNRYEIRYLDMDSMRTEAKEKKIPHFNEILNKYYTKE